MSSNGYRHLYGPVPSRRLGSSLGVDIIPPKICSYNCIYCQLGCTTNQTVRRAEYISAAEVLEEVEKKLKEKRKPGYITLAGSGEPTLHSGIGYIIKGIKELTDIPVTVLTNGSLLWMDEVKEELMGADIVLPSLDAGDSHQFKYVNRPHWKISYPGMVQGIADFTKGFPGRVWLEVFLMGGVTDTPAEVRKIADKAGIISPDRIQLNTVCRPPAEQFSNAVPHDSMLQLRSLFPGKVEIISGDGPDELSGEVLDEATGEDILDLISRRPCTSADVSVGLGIHLAEAVKHLQELIVSGRVIVEVTGGRSFYRLAERNVGAAASGKVKGK